MNLNDMIDNQTIPNHSIFYETVTSQDKICFISQAIYTI
jgi:hypothetical protein